MNTGTFCGARLRVAALTISAVALAAPAVAAADAGVSLPAAPVAVPAAPALPAAPAPPAASASVSTPVASASVSTATPSASVSTPVASASASASGVTVKTPVAKVAVKTAPVKKAAAKASAKAKVWAKRPKTAVSASATVSSRSLSASTGSCQPADGWLMCKNVTFSDTLNNSCNGDLVQVTGQFHDMVRTKVDPLTGMIITDHRMNWQGVKGVSTMALTNPSDPTSPTVTHDPLNYTAADTTYDRQDVTPIMQGLALQYKTENQENNELVSQGTQPNQIFHVKITTIVTLDPLGNMTGFDFDVSGPGLKCTG